MKATVDQDTSVRTILVEVQDVPDIDATETWHRRARIFRPDFLQIRVTDGRLEMVKASGGLVKKDGSASIGNRESKSWLRPEPMPEWVRTIVRGVLAGETSWNES